MLLSIFLKKLELQKLEITLFRDDDVKVGVGELCCEVFADNKTRYQNSKKTKYQNLESEMKTRQHAVCFRGLVVKYVIL